MALVGAAAILVANGGANRPRGLNIHREGCISAESDRTSVRLDRNEVLAAGSPSKRSLTPNLILRLV